MSDRWEYVHVTEVDHRVSSAMEMQLQAKLNYGAKTAELNSRGGCEYLEFCGVALNVFQKRRMQTVGAESTLGAYGVQVSAEGAICPRGVIREAIARNDDNDFWVLKADELSGSTDRIKTAQAVELTAEAIAQIINKKIII